MSSLLHDAKVALRALAGRPAFSALTAGMLALGIAGNVAIFTIYSGLFLRPLPLPQPDRLVDLDETAPKWNLRFVSIAKPDFDAWREDNSTFDSMAAYDEETFNLSGRGAAQRLTAVRVTADMMKVLRATPQCGRGFQPSEANTGGSRVVMLGDRIWRQRFGAEPGLVGQILKLDGEPYTVVGVLPPNALLPVAADIWVPLAMAPEDRSGWFLHGIGRLKAGVTVEQAADDLTRIHRRLVSAGRKDNGITSPTVMPLKDKSLGSFRLAGNMLLGAAGLVLLIACANVAGLMMVRAAGRAREVAIRTALGASRAAIVRQLFTESLMYALAGGAAGVLAARALLRILLAHVPESPLPWLDLSMDHRALLFSLAITFASAILFGLAPALLASRTDTRAALHATAPSAAGGRRTILSALVTTQIAFTVILTATAALLFQSLRHAVRVDPGFRPEGVLTYRLALPQAAYPERAQLASFFQTLVGRMREIPGVRAAGAASLPPLAGHWGMFFMAEGGPPQNAGDQNPVVLQVLATPGYLEAIGIPLLAGRQFTERDGEDKRVAIVNQSFAKRFFPGVNPIGRRFRYVWRQNFWLEIIGVARDVKHYGLDREAAPGVFIPYRQWVVPTMNVVLRTDGDPGALVAPAREALRRMDPDLPMFEVTRMTEAIDRSLWTRRCYSLLAVAFAAIAVVLAAAGAYGVISYAVAQRTREIGIRVALGATSARITRHVLRHGLVMLAIGVPAGVAGMLAVSRLVEKLLFGVEARDPLTYAATALAAAAVALAANLVPARRAAAITPSQALRSE